MGRNTETHAALWYHKPTCTVKAYTWVISVIVNQSTSWFRRICISEAFWLWKKKFWYAVPLPFVYICMYVWEAHRLTDELLDSAWAVWRIPFGIQEFIYPPLAGVPWTWTFQLHGLQNTKWEISRKKLKQISLNFNKEWRAYPRRRIFGPKRDEVKGDWRSCIMRSVITCTPRKT
jgi:hypothetical protein